MDSYSYRREREGSNPSFSSTLLDAIYRSIDEGDDEKLVLYRETMRKKVLFHGSNLKGKVCFKDEEEMADFQRVCMIEKWMEKKEIINQKVVNVRRRSLADFVPKVNDYNPEVFFSNSSWSSSDSSSNGGFSSSEAESVHGGVSSRSSSSCYGLQKPKPIRTSVSVQQEKSNKNKLGNQLNMHHHDHHALQQKPKHEGKFAKTTKSRALKMIYGDLKKVKQPISPGGKLASFLNSLFSAGNAKKAKITDHEANSERKVKSANASTCSSASSFSRSCLSKTTPSSRTKSSNGMKRSVRFYPVSVIVDEDCQPCAHKNLYEEKSSMMEGVKDVRISINEELKFHAMEKNRRVEEAKRDLLRNYHKRVELDYDLRTTRVKDEVFDHNCVDDEEEDDDDAASYASSDLFELDNLSAIGMERYREELPVYETTHLDTNRAIANGMIL